MSLDAFVITSSGGTPGGTTGAVEYSGGAVFVGAGWKMLGTAGSERLVGPSITDDGTTKLQAGTLAIGSPTLDTNYASVFRPPTDIGVQGIKIISNNQTQNVQIGWGGVTCSNIFDFTAGGRLAFTTPAGVVIYCESAAQRFYVGGATTDDGTTLSLQAPGISATQSDSGTNNIVSTVIVGHNSSATPTVGFGVSQLYQLKSSTTTGRSAGEIDVTWATATDASRKARMALGVWDNTAKRTGIQLDTDGSAPQITFPSGLSAINIFGSGINFGTSPPTGTPISGSTPSYYLQVSIAGSPAYLALYT